MACLFYLLDLGVPKEKIELWHQSIDGGGEHYTEFMDWPVTESYLEAVGEHFGIKTSYQWRAHGIYGELLRKNSLTGDVYYCEDGKVIHLPTKNGKKTTRLMWPATSPDLRVRWCSPYVKIDVFRRVLNNHPRFQGTKEQPKKVLVLTGERREESPNRARYLGVNFILAAQLKGLFMLGDRLLIIVNKKFGILMRKGTFFLIQLIS